MANEDVHRKGTEWAVLFADYAQDCQMHCLLNLVILEHKCVFSLPQGVNQNIPRYLPIIKSQFSNPRCII